MCVCVCGCGGVCVFSVVVKTVAPTTGRPIVPGDNSGCVRDPPQPFSPLGCSRMSMYICKLGPKYIREGQAVASLMWMCALLCSVSFDHSAIDVCTISTHRPGPKIHRQIRTMNVSTYIDMHACRLALYMCAPTPKKKTLSPTHARTHKEVIERTSCRSRRRCRTGAPLCASVDSEGGLRQGRWARVFHAPGLPRVFCGPFPLGDLRRRVSGMQWLPRYGTHCA